ncbi:MAG: hypothetical protein IPI49_05440 [Myxococcales bacterium]|nr:hypothetical protein [Myxococcales bacterium]
MTALAIECYILPTDETTDETRISVAQPETNTSDSPTAPRPDDIKPVQIGGESFADRIMPHMKKITITLGVVAVIVTVVFVIRGFGERGRAKETAKLGEVAAVAARQVRGTAEEPQKGIPSFANNKERAAAVLDAIAKHPSELTPDAYRAAMAYEAEQYDTAITAYRAAAGKAGLDGVLAREGLTVALEAKANAEKDPGAKQKGLEEALTAARAIQPDANGARRVYGLYHEARLLLILGKTAEAKPLLEKVRTMGEGTELESLVEARLAALETGV